MEILYGNKEDIPFEFVKSIQIGGFSNDKTLNKEADLFSEVNDVIVVKREGFTRDKSKLYVLAGKGSSDFHFLIFDRNGKEMKRLKFGVGLPYRGLINVCYLPKHQKIIFAQTHVCSMDISTNSFTIDKGICKYNNGGVYAAATLFSSTQCKTDVMITCGEDLFVFVDANMGSRAIIWNYLLKKVYHEFDFSRDIRSFKFVKGKEGSNDRLLVGCYGSCSIVDIEEKTSQDIFGDIQFDNDCMRYIYSMTTFKDEDGNKYYSNGDLFGHIRIYKFQNDERHPLNLKENFDWLIERREIRRKGSSYDYHFNDDAVNIQNLCGNYLFFSTKKGGAIYCCNLKTKKIFAFRYIFEKFANPEKNIKERILVTRWVDPFRKKYMISLTKNFVTIWRNLIWNQLGKLSLLDLMERYEYLVDGLANDKSEMFLEGSKIFLKSKKFEFNVFRSFCCL